MVRDPEPEEATEAVEPSKAMAGIGAALPFVLSMGCCLLVPFVGGGGAGGAAQLAQEMGWSFYAIMLVAPLSGILAGALVGVAGTGRRVPTVLAIFAATLPWLVGLAGHRYGLHMVEGALTFADPSMRAALIAQGVAESSTAHLYGAGVSAGVLLGTSLGLALAAVGQRAPQRTFLGAGFALLSLPLLAAGGWLISVSPVAAGTPIAIALGVVVATGLACAAVGKDEPKFRSAALSVGAVTAGVLAFVAAASAAATAAKIEVFSALAMMSGESRMEILAATAEELAPATTVATWGFAIGLLPLLAAIAWAAGRGKLSIGMVVGGAATTFVLLLVLGLDGYIVRVAPQSLAELASAPWHDHEDFEPVVLDAYDDDGESHEVRALVLDGSLVPIDGEGPVPVGSGQEALAGLIRRLVTEGGGSPLDTPPPQPDMQGVLGMLQQLQGTNPLPSTEPSLDVAFDRHTDGATMRRVIDAAEAAGVKSLWWTGLPGAISAEQRERITDQLPLIGALAEQPSSVRVRLSRSLPATFVAIDSEYYHGTITAGATEITLEPRAASGQAPLRLAPNDYSPRVDFSEEPIAYLLVAEGATVEDVSRVVGLAANRGFTPALYFDQLPPESALGDAAAVLGLLQDGGVGQLGGLLGDDADAIGALLGDDGEGTIGLGNLGTIGSQQGYGHSGPPEGERERPEGRVRSGESDVVGSLPREVIRRVIRRHINEARYCYERELARDPDLAGRVTISFVISPDGSVASADVASSTLGSDAVESCLSTAVRRWAFPAPQGGGIVRVSYPFEFQSQ
jgi:TonB family protein